MKWRNGEKDVSNCAVPYKGRSEEGEGTLLLLLFGCMGIVGGGSSSGRLKSVFL
jgi:hypothetical protein